MEPPSPPETTGLSILERLTKYFIRRDFFKNPILLGLGGQFGLKCFGAFEVFSPKLSEQINDRKDVKIAKLINVLEIQIDLS